MDLVEQFEHSNRTVKVYLDPEPLNPRKEWDNATFMVHWHRRYDLGDKRVERCTSDELKEEYAKRGDAVLAILPLYLYDHSGLSVSTSIYTCNFDSGQVGWVFITQSKSDLMGFEGYDQEKFLNVIKSEVLTYDKYLSGQVYGYEVLGKEGDCLGSCWSYFDFDSCVSDAKVMAQDSEDPAVFGDNLEEHF